MVKSILVALLLACSLTTLVATTNPTLPDEGRSRETVFKGTVINPEYAYIGLKIYPEPVSREPQLFSIPLSNKQFSLTFDLTYPTEAHIIYGPRELEIYIEPGDQLEVLITDALGLPDAKFGGIGATNNKVLRQFRNQFKQYDDGYVFFELSNRNSASYRKHLDKLRTEQLRFVASVAPSTERQLSTRFKQYLQAEIDYWWAYQLLRYRWEHPAINGLPVPIDLPPKYYTFFKAITVENPAALYNQNYLYFLGQYLNLREEEPGMAVLEAMQDQQFETLSARLRLRAQPAGEPVLEQLTSGSRIQYLGERSEFQSTYTMRGQSFTDYWYKVRSNSGTVGWVFGGGVKKLRPPVLVSALRTRKVETVEEVRETIAISRVSSLRIRRSPDQPTAVGKAKEGEELTYLGEKTANTYTYQLRGQSYTEPFYKVRTADGRVGWVFGGAIELEDRVEMRTVIRLEPIEEEVKTVADMTPAEKYLKGQVSEFMQARELVQRSEGEVSESLREDVEAFERTSAFPEYMEVVRMAYQSVLRRENLERIALQNERPELNGKVEAIASVPEALTDTIGDSWGVDAAPQALPQTADADILPEVPTSSELPGSEPTLLVERPDVPEVEAEVFVARSGEQPERTVPLSDSTKTATASPQPEPQRPLLESAIAVTTSPDTAQADQPIAGAVAPGDRESADASPADTVDSRVVAQPMPEATTKPDETVIALEDPLSMDYNLPKPKAEPQTKKKRQKRKTKRKRRGSKKGQKRMPDPNAPIIGPYSYTAKKEEPEAPKATATDTPEPTTVAVAPRKSSPIKRAPKATTQAKPKPAVATMTEAERNAKIYAELDSIVNSLTIRYDDNGQRMAPGETPRVESTTPGIIDSPEEIAEIPEELLRLSTPDKTVTQMTGSIVNYSGKPIELILYSDPITYREMHYRFTVNSSGSFVLPVELARPTIGKLVYGDRHIEVYLEPGDRLAVSFDGNSFGNTIRFSGTGGVHNNFLRDLRSRFANADEQARKKTETASPSDYKQFMDQSYRSKLDFLEQYPQRSKFSARFAQFARADVDYWYAYLLLNYPWEHPYFVGTTAPMQMPSGYFDFLDRIPLNNDGALPNEYYTYFLDLYFENEEEKRNDFGVTRLSLAKEQLTGEALYYYTAKRLNALSKMGKTSRITADLTTFLQESTYEQYNDVLILTYNQTRGIQKGSKAPSFTLFDIDGNQVSLSDFEGSVVYIDFWATWCIPCIHEMQSAQRLKRRFKGKPVEFVYISVDANRDLWANYVKQHRLKGVHLYASGEFQSEVARAYGVQRIPNFVMIDKEGNIAAKPALRPGSTGIAEQIYKVMYQGM